MATSTTRPPAWSDAIAPRGGRTKGSRGGRSLRGEWPKRTALAAVLALTAAASTARASEPREKEQCIAAADQAQQLRDATKYLQAREAFSRCARESCPNLVRQDCAQWLQELDERIPTVVFAAQDDRGADLVDVSVSVDGAQVATALDGKPAPIDPGEHALRFEAPGFVPVDGRVVVRAGEKNRVVGVRFRERVVVQLPPAAPPPPPPPVPELARPRRPPVAAWVFGGVALAAFATEAYFGVSGLTQRSADLSRGGCAPGCPAGERAAIQTKFAVADISLGIGLVSAGFAAYFFLASRAPAAAPAAAAGWTFDVVPGGASGGGTLTVRAKF